MNATTTDPEVKSAERSASGVDKIGATCSAFCAVHCGLMALAPGIISALGLTVLLGPSAEWGLTILAIAFAFVAMAIGWKNNRSKGILLMLGLGICGLFAGRMVESMGVHGLGTVFSVGAGALLVVAHMAGIVEHRSRSECL